MKHKKILIAASVIAASLLAGSAFAGREGGVKQTRQAEQARPMDAAIITSQTATRILSNLRKSRGSTEHQGNISQTATRILPNLRKSRGSAEHQRNMT